MTKVHSAKYNVRAECRSAAELTDELTHLSKLWEFCSMPLRQSFKLFEIRAGHSLRQRPSEDKIFWPPFQPFQLPVKRETVER